MSAKLMRLHRDFADILLSQFQVRTYPQIQHYSTGQKKECSYLSPNYFSKLLEPAKPSLKLRKNKWLSFSGQCSNAGCVWIRVFFENEIYLGILQKVGLINQNSELNFHSNFCSTLSSIQCWRIGNFWSHWLGIIYTIVPKFLSNSAQYTMLYWTWSLVWK